MGSVGNEARSLVAQAIGQVGQWNERIATRKEDNGKPLETESEVVV